MQKIGTQLNLRSRVIAMLLAALMVVGMAFMALPSTFAHAIEPTGDEYVYNPEDQYVCPQGGLFRFAGEGFVEDTTIVVELKSTGVLLGSFDIDEDGNIVPAITGEKFAAVIIPAGTVPNEDALLFFYEDGTDLDYATFVDLEVSPTPYTASFEIVRNLDGTRSLHVYNTTPGLWAPDTDVYFKIDYRDNPTYGPFTTDAVDGTFDVTWALPSSLINTGVHAFTLLAGEETVGTTFYPRVSISQNLTL
jgi:hypothetical protein